MLTFRAVAAISNHDLLDMQRRMTALQSFADAEPDAAASLAAANKRVVNLMAKSAADDNTVRQTVASELLQQPEEQALFDALP